MKDNIEILFPFERFITLITISLIPLLIYYKNSGFSAHNYMVDFKYSYVTQRIYKAIMWLK